MEERNRLMPTAPGQLRAEQLREAVALKTQLVKVLGEQGDRLAPVCDAIRDAYRGLVELLHAPLPPCDNWQRLSEDDVAKTLASVTDDMCRLESWVRTSRQNRAEAERELDVLKRSL